MTLSELLEELKGVDAEQSEKLQCWIGRTRQFMNLEVPLECDLAQALIQNSIQRACERREWYAWKVGANPYLDQKYRATIGVICESHISDHIVIDDIAVECGDSPAEALLAAYIAAVKGEKKRSQKMK